MWQEIPIYINNRNRLSTTQKLVNWLVKIGCKNICIIDNASTYPPLLNYYANHLPASCSLIKLQENIGPYAFWALDLHSKNNSPYIVTDADVFPADFCPDDLIERMLATLIQYPAALKVGPSLQIDNLPDGNKNKNLIYDWEMTFWHKPFARGLFEAEIDTTFAIYPEKCHFSASQNNIRLGYPYLMTHHPWHIDDKNISEEDDFYQKNASKSFSYWGANSREKEGELQNKINQRPKPQKILHIGCGNEYIPGWINMDISGRKLDIRFDLEQCTNESIPLLDNSVDGVYACHVFEHIENSLALMQELHRVCKNGAKFFMRLPYGSSDDAWEDPTHKRAIFENSFLYFSQPAYSKADYHYQGDWQAEKIVLVAPQSLIELGFDAAYKIIRSQRNIVQEMIVELRCIKPVRQRLLSQLHGAQELVLSSSHKIIPVFD